MRKDIGVSIREVALAEQKHSQVNIECWTAELSCYDERDCPLIAWYVYSYEHFGIDYSENKAMEKQNQMDGLHRQVLCGFQTMPCLFKFV